MDNANVDMVFNQPKPCENEDEDNLDAALRVPSEIWVKILLQLNQKELVRARTVCSTWRSVVDEHFQFSVIVHDEKTDLETVYRLRIKDCLITKLLEDVDILQYPDLLKRARFWGPINIANIIRIMSQAIKLEELSMTRCALTKENLFQEENSLVLKNLLKLELLGYCCKDAGEAVSNNVVHLLSYNMPVLQKVFINVTCHWKQMDPMVVCFFEFLARHKRKVSHVNASLIPASGGHEAISHLPTRIPQDVKDLVYDQELQLESLRLTIASKYISCWAPVISSQKKLSELRIHWTASGEPPHPTLTGISAGIMYPAIIQSATNLVQVDLRDFNLAVDERRNAIPFDASIFRCAHNLRRLTLVRNKDDCQRLTENYGSATIINLDAIAPSLEDFELVRLKCSSTELQKLIDSATSLKNVKLHHTGTSSGKGVHGGIVESTTKKTGIKIMNFCPINYYDPEQNKKLDALKPIFEGICSGSDRVYFDFDRFRQGKPQPCNKIALNTYPVGAEFSSASGSTRSTCPFDAEFDIDLDLFTLRQRQRTANVNFRIRTRHARSVSQDSSRNSVPAVIRRCRRGLHARPRSVSAERPIAIPRNLQPGSESMILDLPHSELQSRRTRRAEEHANPAPPQ